MNSHNVEPTVEKINEMARIIRHYADEIENHGRAMQRTGDLTYAAEVLNAYVAMITNSRLDLMVTRPLREVMK